ncbi:MAG TPA: D-xylose ABC transporter ATP-binding protein [Treponema sp.]|nr:MAG: D-xylose ABC transporter ATP-binding protein [Treponema sp. GWA1_62_8]OHE71193.1 MAG: D-xylose ABC transporter ATP-binding protein [Treponema sp. RIFOXYC1_FULL_61_9]HCM27028.1 D-xylose ABC transporter ATP-binding protein [Treponema sp.]
METEYLLQMKNVSKQFPGVRALDNVELSVKKGTVHALMGENGAGKSTLMKCLIGIYAPNQGTITFKGEQITIANTHYALSKGISMIHQELSPIPHMTVAENIYLGREPTQWNGLVDMKLMNRNASELLERLNIDLDPRFKMHRLSIANTQLVEIAKAVSYDSDLIVMDEPTSAITESEVEILFSIIRALRKKSISVIYITHKMDEVFKICDEVTVFRDGRYISTDPIEKLTSAQLIQKMVGRELVEMFHKERAVIGETVLDVRDLSGHRFRNVSFEVKRGEIFGVAGLMGAGRTELLESVFGVRKTHGGEIHIHGRKVAIHEPVDAIRNGMALLTEDRKLTGLYLNANVRDNMAIANINEYMQGPFVNFRKIDSDCERMRILMQIKTPSLQQTIKNLSGGNQQKVLISRWLLTEPNILILDEPTRGIDVGAKSEIYRLMIEFAKQGKSIIMISSELPEILGMSDRIMVMHEGDKVGELSRAEATQEKILHMATGLSLTESITA